MERLLTAVEELSLARTLADVQRIVRTTARELTGCDGATFVLNADGLWCYYADEDAIEPLWKGKRFPQEACISGWVMRNRVPAVIPDIYADARIPHEAYRPTFVKSLAMVPIRQSDPVGAIGNYWATHHATTSTELKLLQALANATSVAMENVRVYAELEARVRDRTADLVQANGAIHRLSVTDELTGLLNRRGFYEAAERELRASPSLTIIFIDVDGLKAVNDGLGHAAGDALLRDAAETIKSSFRQTDVVARVGGDEFCVLVPHPVGDPNGLKHALSERFDKFNSSEVREYRLSASIGVAPSEGSADLDALILEADRQMYAEKQRRYSRGDANSIRQQSEPA
jgi:diguanylate cyclase (GGDEF)-like protein